MIDAERLHEVRCIWEDRLVHAVEANLDGAGFDACAVEHVLQADSGPTRVSHGAVRPLSTGHTGLEITARIARALIDRGKLDAWEREEVVERQRQAAVDVAVHRQPER